MDPSQLDAILNSVVTLVALGVFYGANVVALGILQVAHHKTKDQGPIPWGRVAVISIFGGFLISLVELIVFAGLLAVVGTLLGLVAFGLLLAICGGG